MRRKGNRRELLAAALLLALIACAWFWPLLRGHQLGQSFTLNVAAPWAAGAAGADLPKRAFLIDAALQFEPWAEIARAQLRDGYLPLWNPHEWGGTTLAGNMQSALFYPPNWLLLVLPFGTAWGLLALAKMLIAGLGAAALCRELGARRGGAVVAGCVYMLSAPLMTWLQYPLAGVFGLLPWLLLATSRVFRGGSAAAVAGLALSGAIAILAGHPESTLIAVSAAGVMAIGLLAFDPVARAAPRVAARRAGQWLGGLLLGGAVAAVALVPFALALAPSVTLKEHALGLPSGGPSVAGLLHFGMPRLFGNGEPDLYGLPHGYFGLPALLLALVALWRGRRNPGALALSLMAAVTLMAVYHVPPVQWFLDAVPPWSGSFIGERAFFVVALAGAVGAGCGVSSLIARPLALRTVALLAAGAGAAIAAGYVGAELAGELAAPADLKRQSIALTAALLVAGAVLLAGLGRLRPAAGVALALVVAVASLADLQNLNVTLPPRLAYPPKPPSVGELERRPGSFRMSVLRDPAHPITMLPNGAARYGLDSVEGYDYPLSERWSDFQTRALGFSSPAFPEGRFSREPPAPRNFEALRAMNVRYYLAAPGTPAPAGLKRIYQGPDAALFRDPLALPRAYVVPAVRRLGDGAALAAVSSGRLDFRRVAVVPPGTPAVAGAGFRPGQVEHLAPDHVRVALPPGAAGWLVLANAYAPSWRAEVDGREVKPSPTNHAATGVPVRAGARTVDFRVDRTGFHVGLAITLAALVATGALALRDRRRRKA